MNRTIVTLTLVAALVSPCASTAAAQAPGAPAQAQPPAASALDARARRSFPHTGGRR